MLDLVDYTVSPAAASWPVVQHFYRVSTWERVLALSESSSARLDPLVRGRQSWIA